MRKTIGPIVLNQEQYSRAYHFAERRHKETPGKQQAADCRDYTIQSSLVGALAEVAFLIGLNRYYGVRGTNGLPMVPVLSVNSFGKADFGLNIQVRGGYSNVIRKHELEKYPWYRDHVFVYVSNRPGLIGGALIEHYMVEGWLWGEELEAFPPRAPDPSRVPNHFAPTECLRSPETIPPEAWGDIDIPREEHP